MAVKRKYRLNLRNYGNLPAIMLSQYDEGYALEFEIRDGTDAASDLSAYTVTLKGTRADTLAYSFAGTVSTNVLTFVIDTTMTACAGRGTAEIAIKDTANDVLFATFNMPVFVERAAVPEGSIDADVERAQEIAEQVQEIVDNAAAAVSGAAEKWATGQINGTDVPSTDPTYENNAKYYAEQAETAAESIGIDATLTQAGKAADAKKTGDEITALKEELNNINYIDEVVTDGSYIDSTNGNAVSASSWAYKTFNVEGLDGESATISTKLYSGSVAGWAVFLKDGTYHNGGTSENTRITLPANVGSVKVSCFKNYLTVEKIRLDCNYSKQLTYKTEIPDIHPLEESIYTSSTYAYSNYKDDWAKGCLNVSGGIDLTNSWRTTDYIELYAGSKVHYKLSMYTNVVYVAFYDVTKTFISSIVSTVTNNWKNKYTEGDLILPSNATYFRMSLRADNDTLYNDQLIYITNEKTAILEKEIDALTNKDKKSVRVLIIGDSYSANTDKWIAPMMEEFSEDSSYISLAVSSATVKDQNQDRTTYPYTSRPLSSNTAPNTNTFGCQIAKLKRLMAGVDLDEGETAIYQTESEYPNIIIIQGGENDWKDGSTSAYNDQYEVAVENVYYSRWGNVSQGTVYIKPDVETVNRTIFAGAYRYLMDELYALFPKAQFFFTTTSPVSGHQNPVLSLRREVAEQQRICANMCCANLIDWQAESQMSIIVNSVTTGDGTQANPYVVTPVTQDSTDGLHPTEYGGKKLGKLAASVIRNKFMSLS